MRTIGRREAAEAPCWSAAAAAAAAACSSLSSSQSRTLRISPPLSDARPAPPRARAAILMLPWPSGAPLVAF